MNYLETLISEFENHCWELESKEYTDLFLLCSEFEYDIECQNVHAIKANILNDIINELSGDQLKSMDFSRLKNHFLLRYFTYNIEKDKNTFLFLDALNYIGCKIKSYSINIESWLKVRKLLATYKSLSSNDFYAMNNWNNDKKVIAESINFLSKRGFKSEIKSGSIFLSKESELNIQTALQYRLSKIGDLALINILKEINSYYDNQMDRYFLRQEPSLSMNFKPATPWGYLFNIALPYFKNVKSNRNSKKQFNELIELATHYFCIQQLQETNKFQDINLDSSSVLFAVQRNILFDQHFFIDHISVSSFNEMMTGMFTSENMPKLPSIEVYIDILELLSRPITAIEYPLSFKIEDIEINLLSKYNKETISDALDKLSFSFSDVNKGYINPTDIEMKNYYQRPLIKKGNKFIYINPLISSYGFYYSIEKLLVDSGYNRKILGEIAEVFLRDKLHSKNITFVYGKKYKIPKNLKINSEKGECDFVIETDSSILFVELKRKTLTVNSRKGDILQSTLDLATSFLHALSQTARHELVLRRQGYIVFDDGYKLELNGRNIDKISLSLFDFNSMHDSEFIRRFTENLINGKITSNNQKSDEEINLHLNNIYKCYISPEFKDAYINTRQYFMNCQFYSIPQFLSILKYCNNNKDFIDEIQRTKRTSTGSKDWYRDYKYIRYIMNLKHKV